MASQAHQHSFARSGLLRLAGFTDRGRYFRGWRPTPARRGSGWQANAALLQPPRSRLTPRVQPLGWLWAGLLMLGVALLLGWATAGLHAVRPADDPVMLLHIAPGP